MKNIFVILFIFLQNVTWAQIPNWKGTIEIKDNIQYIHNPEEGLWDKDKSKKMTITKIFSLGSLNANEEYLFNWVKDVATDKDGNIYVCDSKENRIQVYDKNGKFLRTIGRKGQGPGELDRPMAIALDNDGNIYIQDDLNKRVTIFKNNGKFYKSFNYRYKGIAGEQIELDGSGNVLINHFSSQYGDSWETLKTLSFPIVTAYNLKGKIVREYGEPQLLLEKDGYGRPRYCSNGFIFRQDGILLVRFSVPYLIHFYRDGKLIKVIDRDNPIFTQPELIETNFEDKIGGRVAKIKAVGYRSNIRFLHVLPDNKFLVCICDKGKNYKQVKSDREFDMILDLYDADGYFLKSFPWDWRKHGLLVHVDLEGYFYSNFGETEIVPGVTKWKASFE